MSEPPAHPRPERVRVTAPRTAVARHPVGPATEIDRRSRLGEVYVSSLMRAQLRLAAGVLAVVMTVLGGVPLLLVAAPSLGRLQVLGMPLPWVLLAAAVYPLLLGAGWFYLRRAERNEETFAAIVGRRAVEDGAGAGRADSDDEGRR